MAIRAVQTQREPVRALVPAEFLKELSAELASGDVRLPSFPDVAQRVQLVAGLMHNIGSLYIIMRAHQHGAVLGADDDATRLLSQGHQRIAGAILGHWKFAPAIVSAVSNQNASTLPVTKAGRLTDVLIAAISLVPCVFDRGLLDDTVTAVAPFQRLALDAAGCERLLQTTARQIKSLHNALLG